jgi:hypothetical protein
MKSPRATVNAPPLTYSFPLFHFNLSNRQLTTECYSQRAKVQLKRILKFRLAFLLFSTAEICYVVVQIRLERAQEQFFHRNSKCDQNLININFGVRNRKRCIYCFGRMAYLHLLGKPWERKQMQPEIVIAKFELELLRLVWSKILSRR